MPPDYPSFSVMTPYFKVKSNKVRPVMSGSYPVQTLRADRVEKTSAVKTVSNVLCLSRHSSCSSSIGSYSLKKLLL